MADASVSPGLRPGPTRPEAGANGGVRAGTAKSGHAGDAGAG